MNDSSESRETSVANSSKALDDLYTTLDELDSIHEAAHAVLTVALMGASFHCVELPYPTSAGSGGGRSRRFDRGDDSTALIIGMAGAGAEILHRPDIGWSWTSRFQSSARGDWKLAQEKINRLALNGDRKQVIKDAKAKTLTYLAGHWDWVLSVASALRKYRYLGYHEVVILRNQPL